MNPTLPLDRMTVADKLRTIDRIWEDLQLHVPEIPAPAWHADVLEARAKRIRKGSAKFEDWADAKRSIRDAIK